MPYWGLLRRKECLIPTPAGWLLVLFSAAVVVGVVLTNIHGFLAINEPVEAQVLVVEGWLPDYALAKAIAEFRSKPYHLMITTGEPLLRGSFLQDYQTYAELAAATLVQFGVGKDSVVAVPAPRTQVDRTYSSALALAQWRAAAMPDTRSINIMTLGVHARRTRLLFQRALGDTVSVGVLSVHDEHFDPGRWWVSSGGVQSVLEEIIGCLYAFL
jgi:hypothetical protein